MERILAGLTSSETMVFEAIFQCLAAKETQPKEMIYGELALNFDQAVQLFVSKAIDSQTLSQVLATLVSLGYLCISPQAGIQVTPQGYSTYKQPRGWQTFTETSSSIEAMG